MYLEISELYELSSYCFSISNWSVLRFQQIKQKSFVGEWELFTAYGFKLGGYLEFMKWACKRKHW